MPLGGFVFAQGVWKVARPEAKQELWQAPVLKGKGLRRQCLRGARQHPLAEGAISITDKPVVKHDIGVATIGERLLLPNVLKTRHEFGRVSSSRLSECRKMTAVHLTLQPQSFCRGSRHPTCG